MSYHIDEIEGVGPAFAAKLKEVGISSTDDLLERCAAKKGREACAEATGISEKHILRWVNMADLMRIRGVGKQFAELLERAGVDSIKELRHRNAENLAAKLNEVNAAEGLTKGSVSADQVAGWIGQARELEPLVTH